MTVSSAWGAAERPPICLVLGTGRCGSTALSDVLREHPDVLSVSELFAGLRGRNLAEREMDGADFWRLLSTPHRADSTLLRFKVAPEVTYPVFEPRPGASRFAWPAELPPVAGVTLPHLTDRPDDLYAVLEAQAPTLPRQPLSEHLWWLFETLSGGRRPGVVVERSGGSLGQTAALLRLFPDARVIHMFRDGRECALSMSRHPRFKLTAIQAMLSAAFGYDPYAEEPGTPEPPSGVPAGHGTLTELAPGRLTRAAFDRFDVPLARYGLMWSNMVAAGFPALPPEPRLLSLDYGDLVRGPRESIRALFAFLGVARDLAREDRQAAGITKGRDARSEVDEREWAELTRSCRMGMNRLYGRGAWH
ncbi:sulfotransferase [Streptomyces sp. NPDC001714]|uniref:sulfotransferase n=1 Tax=Streptomyces sp. NPDC001714 TaxID=3364603 RepID=UPI0036BE429B